MPTKAASRNHPVVAVVTMVKWIIIFTALFSILIVYVSQQITMMNLAYEIPQVRGEIGRTSQENDELVKEIAYLESLERLERLATEMGMVPASAISAESDSTKASGKVSSPSLASAKGRKH